MNIAIKVIKIASFRNKNENLTFRNRILYAPQDEEMVFTSSTG